MSQSGNRSSCGQCDRAKNTVVARPFSGQLDAASFKDLELPQPALDVGGGRVRANALKHFAEDDLGQAQALTIELGVEPVGFRIPDCAEVVHPQRFVRAPLLRIAWRTRLSSMSMLVRMCLA